MRTNKNNKPYLNDILEAINSIEVYLQDAPEKEDFIKEKGLYQDAIVRNIEIIGEASKKVDENIKSMYPEMPWRQMAGMRDKITHEYSQIDWEEVWKVAAEDIKYLKTQIQEILAKLG